MPLYEYRCDACGAKEEKLQSFSAPTAHDCPKCGVTAAMQRQISRAAFVLSGSGWYAGGYSGKSGADAKPAKPSARPGGAAGVASGAPAPESSASTAEGVAGVEGADAKASCAAGCACHSPKTQDAPEGS